MNGGPISWKIRRQDNVSLSTSEAEFSAASQAGQEETYLRETLIDFGYSHTKATRLHEDNLACVTIARIRCAGNSLVTSTSDDTSCENSF